MTFRALKNGVFALEGLNGFATSLFFNYLFFYLKDRYGVGDTVNLLFGAANGFIYMFASLYAGRWAQRHGYFNSLRLGFSVLVFAMLASALARTVAWQFAAMTMWTVGVCFTWPALEALSADYETGRTLPGKIGFYNIVWAATQALAFFSGRAIMREVGEKSIFFIPMALHLAQLGIVAALKRAGKIEALPGAPTGEPEIVHEATSPEVNQRFLRMAWLANPFAYIAMNTIIPLMPALALRWHWTPVWTGVFGSIWMFARLASFGLLWKWTGWHYRFGWLASAYLFLIVSFASVLLSSNRTAMIFAQVILGFAAGLIYYSSLFYSMDASDTKGAHGGIHEAAIGFGIFGGPAISVAAMCILPAAANSGVWAVSAVLSLGMGGLFLLRKR